MRKTKKTLVETVPAVTISPQELAQILILSEQELVRLTKSAVLVRTTEQRSGRPRIVYDWRENVRRYIAHLQKPREESRDAYQDEKRLTQQIVRQSKELELSIARGEMLKRDRVVLVMTNLLGQIKNHMLGLPARLTRQLIMQKDPHKIRVILDTAVRNCLLEANKFGSHSFDEFGRNGATLHGNDAITRVKKRVAKRRRRTI